MPFLAPSFLTEEKRKMERRGKPFFPGAISGTFFYFQRTCSPGRAKGHSLFRDTGKDPVSSCKKHPQPLLHKRGFGLFVAVRLHGQMYTSISIPAFLSGPAPCCRSLQNLLPVYSTRETVSAHVRWTGATPRSGSQGTFAA